MPAQEAGQTTGTATSEVREGQTAAPMSDTPSPSPPLVTPSPPPSPLLEAELDEHQEIESLLQNAAPDFNPVDHNLPHLLRTIAGTDDLISVYQLRLRVISHEMSLQRLSHYVPRLRELDLDGSSLESLRDLGCGLTSLQVLRVARCGLNTLDGTFGLTSLRELHADGNLVEDTRPCTSLPYIRFIDLNRNRVKDMENVEFLSICPRLEDLILAGCPAALLPDYRDAIKRLLPRLITLDGVPLHSDAELEVELSEEDDEEDDDDDEEDCDENNEFADESDQFLFDTYPPDNDRDAGLSAREVGGSGSDEQRLHASGGKVQPSEARTPVAARKGNPLMTSTPNSRRLVNKLRRHRVERRTLDCCGGSDPSSELTSGAVICGNLARCLRGRNSSPLVMGASRSLERIDTPYPFKQKVLQSRLNKENQTVSRLLDSSRRWRELYKYYRSENSERWLGQANSVDPAVEGAELTVDDVEDSLLKQASTDSDELEVTAMMESLSMTSYDADTSTNLESPAKKL